MIQRLQECWLLCALAATNKSNNRDDTLDANGIQTLRDRLVTTDFDHVMNTHATSDFPGFLTPVWSFLVVDDIVRTKILQFLGLGSRGSGRDDTSPRCLGELQGKDAHTPCALSEDSLTRRKRF